MGAYMDLSLTQLQHLEPATLIQARTHALERAHFKFIYASYHPDSTFRRNFRCCNDYLAHVQSDASVAPQIDECKILFEDIALNHAQVLYRMQITLADGSETGYYEVAQLKYAQGGWRYFCGYKVPLHELSGVLVQHISCDMIIRRGVCF